ncbi:MAG: hypothetical protein KIS92_26770 [Planctomycetota bacterium]|nr:hypothetical protein [Planctomycetota bacterium]
MTTPRSRISRSALGRALCLVFVAGTLQGCGPAQVKVSGQEVKCEGAGFWDRRRLQPFFEDVRVLAFEYSRQKNMSMRCERMPSVMIVRSSEELEKFTGLPAKRENMVLHGACDYSMNRIYSLSSDEEVLAHELGHWYFSDREEIADDFMEFVAKNRGRVKQIAQDLGPLPTVTFTPPPTETTSVAPARPGANRPPIVEVK